MVVAVLAVGLAMYCNDNHYYLHHVLEKKISK